MKKFFSIFKNFLGMGGFFSMVKKACEKGDEVSSTRLTSFIVSAMIILFCFYFLFIGVYIVVTECNKDGIIAVSIPNEMIIVFASLLAHQLTLLGINKYNETKQNIAGTNNKKEPKENKQILGD